MRSSNQYIGTMNYLRKNTHEGPKGSLIIRQLGDLSESPTNSKIDCTPIGLIKTNLKDLDEQSIRYHSHQDLSLSGPMGNLQLKQVGGLFKSPTNSNAGSDVHRLPWTDLKGLDALPALCIIHRDLSLLVNWLVLLAAGFILSSLQPTSVEVSL